MPDKFLLRAPYHTSRNIDDIGYMGSSIKTATLKSIKNTVKSFFGENCFPTTCMIHMPSGLLYPTTSTITYSHIIANTDVDLPTIGMLFGQDIFGVYNYSVGTRMGGEQQFSGAILNPARFAYSCYPGSSGNDVGSVWLMNPKNTIYATALEPFGTTINGYVDNASVGVRPYAVIEG